MMRFGSGLSALTPAQGVIILVLLALGVVAVVVSEWTARRRLLEQDAPAVEPMIVLTVPHGQGSVPRRQAPAPRRRSHELS